MTGERSSDFTTLVDASRRGDAEATDRMLPALYEELRRLAEARMANERVDHTLQATALVHEAYLKLVGDVDAAWQGRGHFFGAAARAMRQVLVDRARHRLAAKRGGDRERVPFEQIDLGGEVRSPEEILALDEALERLEAIDPRKAQLLSLRLVAGLTIEQTASAMELSKTTVKDEWAFARAWLRTQMAGPSDE